MCGRDAGGAVRGGGVLGLGGDVGRLHACVFPMKLVYLSTFRKEEEKRIAVFHYTPPTRVLPLMALTTLVLRDRANLDA